MTRELTAPEANAAVPLCWARGESLAINGHHFLEGACPTCRADIVRLVDGPAAPLPSGAGEGPKCEGGPCKHGFELCEPCAYDRGFADGKSSPLPVVREEAAPPLPEIRAEDVRELRLCVASAKGSAKEAFGEGTIPATVLLDYLAVARILSILDALHARQRTPTPQTEEGNG